MKLYLMVDKLEPSLRARYKRVIERLENNYLFEDERKELKKQLDEIQKEAAKAS